MKDFQKNYEGLNEAQRQAVDTTAGPLIVLAGPGTGKTQLLSLRVGNILKLPGVTPDQILCLTFTDNAARNMQQRLVEIIGRAAYHVAIQTFHSLGDRIINTYPDYFVDRPLLRPIDQLGQYELARLIFDEMKHSNPLSTKVGDDYIFLGDTLKAIGWLKQAGISPNEFRAIIKSNQEFFEATSQAVSEIFAATPNPKLFNKYTEAVELMANAPKKKLPGIALSYAELAARELGLALEQSDPSGRYLPQVTAWRKQWLEKNPTGVFVFKDRGQIAKLEAVAEVYDQLTLRMSQNGLYDFDDMLLEVVQALENNNDLRLNLAERYQYILVDEFQDTNQAQLRLLWSLGDAAPNEGRPNLMVVGDPNQAIYAFQGAFNSCFKQFQDRYLDVTVINLSINYRSTSDILDASLEVIKQNPNEHGLLSASGLALAAHRTYDQNLVEHDVLTSELAHYQWVSDKIREYLEAGIEPDQIAVIAPKHRYLERLVPYLDNNSLPIAYERRENVLDAPLIQEIIFMAELVLAISNGQHDTADHLLGEVLGYDFWKLDAEVLLDLSTSCYDDRSHWLPAMLKHKSTELKQIGLWLNSLAQVAKTEPLEYILDEIGGRLDGVSDINTGFVSPFNSYYFSEERVNNATEEYLNHLGQLTALRQHLRSWQPNKTLKLEDLVEFVQLHRRAGINILSTSPHTQSAKALQLMTAYKAKGLEFEVVFVINTQDEVWGSSARSYVDRVRLPRNLPIKPAGDSQSDRLRLFFVALTRAKHTLHIVSYTHNLDDKLSLGLGFIGGNGHDSQPIHPAFTPRLIDREVGAEAVRILSTSWAYRFRQLIADKPTLFQPILDRYYLSATHLNNFLNVIDAGPEYFLRHNLLRFPEAMSPSAAYGDAIHQTLKMVATHFSTKAELPSRQTINEFFEDILSSKHLRPTDHQRFLERGHGALSNYLSKRQQLFLDKLLTERNFAKEGVMIDEARLSGKIDVIRMLSGSQLEVIDYKTGKPLIGWKGRDEFESIKLHRYQQQLYFYKLLVDNSASFGNKFSLERGGLEFIEPDGKSKELVDTLYLEYQSEELERTRELIVGVWNCIINLDLPDIEGYSHDLSGIVKFEEDIISSNHQKS
jgi:DNA helicase II / ATP-dependent DNA helicase PcrA